MILTYWTQAAPFLYCSEHGGEARISPRPHVRHAVGACEVCGAPVMTDEDTAVESVLVCELNRAGLPAFHDHTGGGISAVKLEHHGRLWVVTAWGGIVACEYEDEDALFDGRHLAAMEHGDTIGDAVRWIRTRVGIREFALNRAAALD